jgi:fructose-1,6-bisphosphatase/inositol monophosphatase family enzyme
VAAGLWDAYVHRQLSPWDSAAGLLLVREAGGVVRTFDGEEATLRSEGVIAAPPALYPELARLAADTAARA